MVQFQLATCYTHSHLCFSAKNDGIIALNTHNNENNSIQLFELTEGGLVVFN